MGFPHSSVGKKSTCNAGDPGSIPGSGRPPGEGNGNPLEYSCLENLMDRGAWWATVHGVERVGYDLVTKLLPMKVKDKGKNQGDFKVSLYSFFHPKISSVRLELTHTAVYKIDNQQGPTV